MTRWTTKTAQAYLDQYGDFSVHRGTCLDPHLKTGHWYIHCYDYQVTLENDSLTSCMELVKDFLLNIIPNGASTLLACPVDYEQPVVVAEFQPEVLPTVEETFGAMVELINELPRQVTQLGWFNEATVARSCPVTYHFSPIDEFGNQETICCSVDDFVTDSVEAACVELHGRLTETDDNIPANVGYLTEEEYQRDQHLLEF